MKRKLWFADPAVWRSVQLWSVVVFSAAFPIGKSPAEAAIVIGLIAWLVRWALERGKLKLAPNPTHVLLVVWFAAAALSCMNSMDLINSVNGLRKLLKVFVLYLLVANTIDSRPALERVLRGTFLGLAIVVLDAGWQALAGADFFYGLRPHEFSGARRITGPFGHPADLAIYLVAVCPLVMARGLFGERKWRAPLLALTGATTIVLLLTLTRGGILGFVGSMIILSVWLRHWAPAALGLLTGAIQAATVPAGIKEWSATEPTWLHKLTQPERLMYWQCALNMIMAHPWVGIGVNTFAIAYPTYRSAGDHFEVIGPYAHNQYLHLTAEIGVFGLAAFLLLLVYLFRAVNRRVAAKASSPVEFVAGAGLGACLVAYLIYGLLESSLFYGKGSLHFWWLAGLIVAVDRLGIRPAARRR